MEPEDSLRQSQCPPPVPILSQLEPVHIPSSHFLKIHFNIILPSKPGSPKWSPTVRFPHLILYTSLPSITRATCPAHLIFLDFTTRTILEEECYLGDSFISVQPLGWFSKNQNPVRRPVWLWHTECWASS